MNDQLNYFRSLSIWLCVMAMVMPSTIRSQNNSLIINGAYITLNGGSTTNTINLVVAQSSTLGIIRNGGGHIHSEGQYNVVKWTSGVSTGSYVLPFGVAGNAADYIPFTFNKTTSGNADISLSTWNTNVQNLPHPDVTNVAAVTNMLGATDSVKNAIDRFWDIKTTAATTADLTFSYRGSENTTLQPGDTIRAQHWNGASWDAAVGVGKPGVTSGIGNSGSVSGQSSFSPWVLTRSCISALPVNLTTIANQQICNGNTASLTAAASGTVSWYTAATGGTAIATGTVYTTPSLTTTTTYYAEQLTACGVSPSRTAITVTVNTIPVVAISTVASSTICSGSSLNLAANGASTYTWSPAFNLSTTTGSAVVASPTATTIYQVTGTDAANCISASANYTVTVNATPTVGLVSAASVTICSGTSTTITPNGAGSYTLNPGALTGSGFTVSPIVNTTYTITGSNASTGCISTAGGSGIVYITVQASPTVGLSSASSTAICSGVNYTITPNGATSYTLNPGNATGSTFVVSPSANTIYTITGTNGITACGSGSASAVTVTLTVKATPTLGLVSAGNATICSGKSTVIIPNGATTYTLNPGALSGSSFTVSPPASTIYTITGTDALTGCTSNSATSVIAGITVNAKPEANAGNDVSTCIGDQVHLTATGGGSYSWSNGANTATTTVTPTNTAYYTVAVTGSNSCVAKDSVKVTVITQGNVLAQNDSTSTSINQSVNTLVSSNDTGSPNTVSVVIPPKHGVATVAGNGSVSYVPNTNYTGMDTLSYTICDATCHNMCSTAKLIIRVNREIIIVVPQWLSPNGDGKNDLFEIKDLSYYPDNELLIFNRWGDEVFFAKPYLNDWDGTYKGKGLVVSGTELVDGTYFYLLKLDKDSKAMKGYLELQRK
jgi:gliding motility-associated-like protein